MAVVLGSETRMMFLLDRITVTMSTRTAALDRRIELVKAYRALCAFDDDAR